MRPSTIAKTLALLSGAVSVVARSLPAQRSEINIRAVGGHGFSSPLEILEDTGISVGDTVSKATSQAATSDVGDLQQSLKLIDLVKISEEMLDGGINISTYSIPVNVTISKRDTALKKRDVVLSGARCATRCGNNPILPAPNPENCRSMYEGTSKVTGQTTVIAHTVKLARWDDCAAQFVNPLNDDVIYNWGDFAGTMQWLNGACIQNGMNIGTCVFGSALSNPAYIIISHSSYFGL